MIARSSSKVCTDSTPDDGQPGALLCDGLGSNVIKVFWLDMRHDQVDPLVPQTDYHRLVIPLVP